MPYDVTPGLVLTSSRYADTLVGGTGADTLNAGQGADRLTGGPGADAFVFKLAPWNGVEITDFELGVDRLDVSALYLEGYVGPNPLSDGHVRFESNGAGGTKVMVDVDGAAEAHPWALHVATLDGVAPTGLTAAEVFGGATGLRLESSRYADTLIGGAGADTLTGGLGPDRLVGGDGPDVFLYLERPWNGGEIADFLPGVDRLDISTLYAGADPVADGHVRFESDGAGSTKVMLDADGPGPGRASLVTILNGVSPVGLTSAQVFGGASPPPLQGGVSLASTGYGQALVGGAGADTLSAGRGPDVLTGSAGADRFVFQELPWNAGHIWDFTPGEDSLDLRVLFASAGVRSVDPIGEGYLSFVADGAGGTRVLFDIDGPGAANPWAFQVTTLDHVAPAGLSARDWLI